MSRQAASAQPASRVALSPPNEFLFQRRADGARRHALHQRDVLVFAFLVGQLKARLPGADALAAP